MHKLPDDRLSALLDGAPNADGAITGLFDLARKVSEPRLYLAALDIERIASNRADGKKPLLGINYARGWVATQVARFYGQFAGIPEGISEDDEELIRYLQLLSYSQFWECLAIQRLIWSIVRTADGEEYTPELLLKSDPGTAGVWKSISAGCRGSGLTLAEFLDAAYHNLIRNAFVHSDIWISHRAISTAPDITSPGPSFHMRFETWDRLFSITGAFLKALFRERRKTMVDLKKCQPYTFSLPEFNGPFTVMLDHRGQWTFKH